ncbi:hypothetical protein [Tsukamurella hominis]|uniref:hypothetical protein n=1 Tax=Tsukamurella hominis TaxID=1970232 RepID=UPI0039EC02F4
MTTTINPADLLWNAPRAAVVSVAELFGYANPEHPDHISGTEIPTDAEWAAADTIAAEYNRAPLPRKRPDGAMGNRSYLRSQLRRTLHQAGVTIVG